MGHQKRSGNDEVGTSEVGMSEERPWGSWHVVEVGDGYKVKRIVVNPRSRLSYQTHEHRSEHWVVVRGIATCVIEGETVVVSPGESVDVGVQHAHRISNEHDDELVIIEVQRGPYLGEDDIVRLQDDYGREMAETVRGTSTDS